MHIFCNFFKRIALILVVFSIAQISFSAEPPRTLGYQGFLRLNDVNVDTSVDMDFTLYSALSGGSSLWTETQTVTVSDGYFSASLGSVTPIPDSVDFSEAYYLEVSVESNTLTPRQKLDTVPYARVALGTEVRTVAPSTTIDGSMYFDPTGSGTLYVYDDTAGWKVLESGTSTIPTLDEAYDAFATATSTITIDASEGQLGGGLKFQTTGTQKLMFDIAGTGNIEIQDNGTAFVTFADGGLTTINSLRVGTLTGLLNANNGTVTAISTSTLAINTNDLVQGSNLFYTDALARNSLSSSATGLTYTSGTGAFSLTSGYNIPLNASTTEWSDKVSSQWTTSGSDVYYSTGNVGVGNSDPTALFSVGTNSAFQIGATGGISQFAGVAGTGLSASAFNMNSAGTATISNASSNSGSTLLLRGGNSAASHLDLQSTSGVGTTDYIKFLVGDNGATEAMRVISSGYVGIGTTTPTARLDVWGNFQVGTSSTPLIFADTATGRVGIKMTPLSGYDFSVNGAAYFGTSASVGSNGQFRSASSGASITMATGGGSSGNITIDTISGTGTDRHILFTPFGNIGIGTTTPAAKLQVLGTTEQFRLSYDASNYVTATVASDGGLTFLNEGTDGDINFDLSGATDGDFSINTDDLFVDTSSGYVGVGTTSPSRLFSVGSNNNLTVDTLGNLHIGRTNQNTTTPAQLIFQEWQASGTTRPQFIFNGVSNWAGLGQADVLTGNHFRLGATTGAGANWSSFGTYAFNLSIDGGLSVGTASIAPTNSLLVSGNVGVGTTTPAAKLHVSTTTEQFRLGYDGTNYSKFTVGSTAGLTFTPSGNTTSAYNFTKADGTTSVLNIDTSNGYVGVGNSSPNVGLEIGTGGSRTYATTADDLFVKGSIESDGVIFSPDVRATSYRIGGATILSGTDPLLVGSQATNIHIAPSGVTAGLYFSSAGNIGIGTTTPAQKLDVYGNFQVGTSSTPLLFVDTANQEVGIGTSTPNSKLDVYGSINVGNWGSYTINGGASNNGGVSLGYTGLTAYNTGSPFIISKFGTTATHLRGGYSTTSNLSLYSTSINSTGTTDYINFLLGDINSPIEFMRIQNNSGVGSLGIGTTTPAAKLQVLGTTEQFRLSYDASNYLSATVASDGGLTFLNAGTDADVNFDLSGATDGDFSINADDLFVDTSTGYIGIGTTTPAQKLDVYGNFQVGTSSTPTLLVDSATNRVNVGGYVGTPAYLSPLVIKSSANTWSGIEMYNSNTGVSGAVSIRMANAASGGTASLFLLQPTGNNSGTTFGLSNWSTSQIRADNSNLVLSSTNSAIVFGTNGSEVSRMTSSGNFGVGTTTPAAKLHVSTTTEQFRLGYDGTNYSKFTVGSTAGLTFTPSGNTTSAYNFTKADGTTSVLNIDTSNGYVGVGTTTPSAKLHIYTNANTTKGLIVQGDNNQSSNIQEWQNSSGTSLAKVNASGDMITNEGGLDAVIGGLPADRNYGGIWFQIDANRTSSNYAFLGSSDETFFNTPSGGTMYFRNNNVTQMLIDSSGKVGIGTTTPAAKLQVLGTTEQFRLSYDASNYLSATVASDGGLTFLNEGTDGDINFDLSGATDGDFSINADDLFVDTSTGYIGIGTTTPATNLDVWGNLRVGTSSTPLIYTDTATGRVGIRTATPTDSLTIRNSSNVIEVTLGGSNQINRASTVCAGCGPDFSFYRTRGTLDAPANVNNGDTMGDFIFRTYSGGANGIWAGFGATKESGGGQLNFSTAFTANNIVYTRMVITPTGLVGIGTTTPATSLGITGVAGTNPFRVASSTNASMFEITQGGNVEISGYVSVLDNSDFGFGDRTTRIGGNAGSDFMNFITNNASSIYINSSNKVGIGTTTPAQKLHVYRSDDGAPVRFEDSNGYCEIDPTSTTWTCTSDRALKDDIISLNDTEILEKITQLDPVSFTWKSDDSRVLRYGLIAQDVEEVFPGLVTTDKSTGYKSVAYGGFTTYLISAVRELALTISNMTTGMIDRIGAKLIQTEELCVGETCITEEELKQLLLESNVSESSNNGGGESGGGNDSGGGGGGESVEVEPESNPEVGPVMPEPEQEEVPVEEVPEPEPEPTPEPESAPESGGGDGETT